MFFILFIFSASIYGQSDLPIGCVVAYAGDSSKIDKRFWRICDGSSLSVEDNLLLFQVLGWRYGYGNDTANRQTFSLPNYLGRFLRGVDLGSGNDPDSKQRLLHYNTKIISGDQVGSIQRDTIKSHNHDINDPKHNHRVAGGFSIDDPNDHKKGGGELTNGGLAAGDHFSTPAPTGITISAFGGSETRPANVSVYWIIKIK